MNQDDWQKLFNVAGPAGAIGFSVAVFRGVINQCGGWRVWLSGLAASILVAVLVDLGMHDYDAPFSVKLAVVGLCAYIARDILIGLTQVSGMIASKPFETLEKVRDFLRGIS